MEKVELPIKTKIAAWWLIVLGSIGIIVGLILTGIIFYYLLKLTTILPETSNFLMGVFFSPEVSPLLAIAFLVSLLFFISGMYILKRKKQGWCWAIIAISIGLTLGFFSPEEMSVRVNINNVLVSIIPLLLLLLDRKNFWKIAT